MRLRIYGLPWLAAAALALTAAGPDRAQTAPVATPARSPAAVGHSSRHFVYRPPIPQELPWNARFATAQCRDGFLVFDPPSLEMCADHGGIHRWLPGRQQPLIRS